MIYFQSLCYQWHKLAFFLLLCYDFGNEVIDMLKSTNLKRRDTYLNKLIGFQDTEPVKVITGKTDDFTFNRNWYTRRSDFRNEF